MDQVEFKIFHGKGKLLQLLIALLCMSLSAGFGQSACLAKAVRSNGQLLGGTLLVVIPCSEGMILVSDRLASSKSSNQKFDTCKLVQLSGKGAIGSVNACEVVAFAAGKRQTLFSASEVAANCIKSRRIDLTKGITAVDAQFIANTLVSSFDKAIKEISGEKLMQRIPIDKLLFGSFVVHYVPAERQFEIIAFNVYRPEAPKRTLLERNLIRTTLPDGASTSVLKFAHDHPKSHVAIALQDPSPCKTWPLRTSLEVGVQMILLAHKAEPNSVGDTFDALLLRPNMSSTWLCEKAKDLKACKYAGNGMTNGRSNR
jgi:hypothetical protein